LRNFCVSVCAMLVLLLASDAEAQERCNLRQEVPTRVGIPGDVAIIFVRDQCFGVYENERLAVRDGEYLFGYASTGGRGHETPLTIPSKGPHRVNRARPDHVSVEYDAPMPFALFFDLQGRALHAGDVRRKNASHGCVRLPTFAAKAIFYGFPLRTLQIILVWDVEDLQKLWVEGYYGQQAVARNPESRSRVFQWGGASFPIDPDMLWHAED